MCLKECIELLVSEFVDGRGDACRCKAAKGSDLGPGQNLDAAEPRRVLRLLASQYDGLGTSPDLS